MVTVTRKEHYKVGNIEAFDEVLYLVVTNWLSLCPYISFLKPYFSNIRRTV